MRIYILKVFSNKNGASDVIIEMNFLSIPAEGYMPTYTRTSLTNALYGSAGFRTDKQIVTKKEMRCIIAQTKKIEK